MAEATLSQSAIYSARPTVRIAGAADARITELVMAMRMEEHEGGMSSLEMRFSNLAPTTDGGAELAFNADSSLKLGADIAVYAGDTAQPREIFRGKVTAMELEYKIGSGPELTVLAEDALSKARRARRSKIYTDQSPADVVNAVASDLGLRPVITGLASPVATWAQLNESALSFLRRLLGHFDADAQIVGDELQVSPRKDVSRGTVELALFGQLAKVRVIADLADQVSSVTTRAGTRQTVPRSRVKPARAPIWAPATAATANPCLRKLWRAGPNITATSPLPQRTKRRPLLKQHSICARDALCAPRALQKATPNCASARTSR